MLDQPYLWWKWLHIVSFTAWMAALFYLPRLYAYHADVKTGSETSELFKKMEFRLLRFIATPAMILTLGFGLMLLRYVDFSTSGWLHAKLTIVFLLAGFHGFCARWRKDFARDANSKSSRFYRLANEFPTLCLLIIVFLAVLKPF